MNPKRLKAEFPYMFAGENIGFSFFRGWFALFDKLCEDIDAELGPDKRGFHWTQLKEKFGSARLWLYWTMKSVTTPTEVIELTPRTRDDGALASQIDALVPQAAAETRSRCIVCGEAATLDEYESYVLVLCEHHARQRRLGELDPPWFSDQEEL